MPGHRDAGDVLLTGLTKTVDVMREITTELPATRSLDQAAGVVLREDRKLYVGLVLLALALFVVLISMR